MLYNTSPLIIALLFLNKTTDFPLKEIFDCNSAPPLSCYYNRYIAAVSKSKRIAMK